MLHKTKGIVLNYIKYRETSIITKIYTSKFGIQSYIVNGVRSKNSKNKSAFFQPLTLLDLVVYHKPNPGLQRISEVKCTFPFQSIPFKIPKSAISIFIAEILNKTLKEEAENNDLFDYLEYVIQSLDVQELGFENTHLKFLIDYSKFLGFFPSTPEDITNTGAAKNISTEETVALKKMIESDSNTFIPLDNKIRRSCLEYLVDFYSVNIENFGNVNSIKILKEVLTQ